MPATAPQPRTVLFFSGQPVAGSLGIDADFAARVLDPFLDMVKTQYATSKHGSVGARGPRRDEAEAKLFLTGLPRGSFGLELSQPESCNLITDGNLTDVLIRLTEVMKAAGGSDEGFAAALSDVAPRVLPRLKDFLRVIADNRADVRVVSGDIECELNHAQVAQAYERVSGTETRDEEVERDGTFRAALLDSGRFDFRTDSGEIVTGRIANEVSDSELGAMISLTNKPCTARLRQTTIATRSGAKRVRHELVGLASRSRADA